jgi:hypothetical protein
MTWEKGQRVVVVNLGRREMATVSRVTPGGRAVVNGQQYRPDGDLVGARGWGRRQIVVPTQEDLAIDARVTLLQRVKEKVLNIGPSEANEKLIRDLAAALGMEVR